MLRRDGYIGTNPVVPESSLKVVSYNILGMICFTNIIRTLNPLTINDNFTGPLHGESIKHEYAPVAITKWTRRRDKLIDEIVALNPDVLCIQETSMKALKETFIPALKRIGLECSGYAPTKITVQGKGRYGHRSIGCAIFHQPRKLAINHSKRVHLKDYAGLAECRSNEFYRDVHSKWNSIAMLQATILSTNQTVVIGNTHLFWNPARNDLKTVQAYAAANAISRFCTDLGYARSALPPIVLCGDLNCLPTMFDTEYGTTASAPFELFTSGKLNPTHPQHPDAWFNKQVNGDSPNPRLGELAISFTLTNIFELPQYERYQPLFTTKTDDFKGWIDHIWVSGGVAVDAVLSTPIVAADLEANLKNREFPPIPNKVRCILYLDCFVVVCFIIIIVIDYELIKRDNAILFDTELCFRSLADRCDHQL